MRIIDTKVWEGQGLRGKSALNDTKTINECDVRQGVGLPLFSELPRAQGLLGIDQECGVSKRNLSPPRSNNTL
jgi:hypothetical protein